MHVKITPNFDEPGGMEAAASAIGRSRPGVRACEWGTGIDSSSAATMSTGNIDRFMMRAI